MTLPGKIFRAVQAAWFLNKARELASKERFGAALAYCEKIERFRLPYFECELLHGVVASRAGFHEMALVHLMKARTLIDSERRLSATNRRYLIAFTERAIDHSAQFSPTLDASHRGTGVDMETIDLACVSAHLKRNFPL